VQGRCYVCVHVYVQVAVLVADALEFEFEFEFERECACEFASKEGERRCKEYKCRQMSGRSYERETERDRERQREKREDECFTFSQGSCWCERTAPEQGS
jgi:hypothetical protein